ncbi:hypothetical protein BGZ72_000846 [Mortierella alpina]|nr:hypothetical protein BGZ72_000846 [Mortierella alpina]
MAMKHPPGQAGPWSKDPRNDVHAFIGYKGKRFPCGGYKNGPTTKLTAGKRIDPPPKGLRTSRHGGGACEFSLSSDKGKTWRVIGQYTKTCPDVYHKWPVLIPENTPECTNADRCLFAFSWTAYATNQFYHHCANVKIINNKPKIPKRAPTLPMTIVDVKQLGQKTNVHAVGDRERGRSKGPDEKEIRRNLSGYYANNGRSRTKSINLQLVRT